MELSTEKLEDMLCEILRAEILIELGMTQEEIDRPYIDALLVLKSKLSNPNSAESKDGA